MSSRVHVRAQEIAKRFSMSVGSAYKLAKQGIIPSIRVGPKLTGVRFDPDAVEAAVDSGPPLEPGCAGWSCLSFAIVRWGGSTRASARAAPK